MKIVAFEGCYSLYLNDLACFLEEKFESNIDKELVSIFYTDKIYFPNFNFHKLKPIKAPYKSYVNSIQNLATIEGFDSKKQALLSDYYSAIEVYLINNKDSLVLLYNDLRWVNSFVIDICNRNNIFYVVFERGVFRPYTTTMDFSGVNANASICNLPFSDDVSSGKESFINTDKESTKLSEIKFSLFFLLKKFESLINPFFYGEIPKSSGKSFYDYFNLLFKKLRIKDEFSETVDLPDKFIFIPLQLSNDTQTLINSPFKSTIEFIEHIISNYYNHPKSKEFTLVFKVHPMDTNKYNFPANVIVTDAPTSELIQDSSYVITINSTVGFEASFSKKVICYGDSFYTNHGFALKIQKECNFLDHLDEPTIATEEYKSFILHNYQVPGSISNYTDIDLNYVSNKIYEEYKSIRV